MTRGGRSKVQGDPERRCIASGQSGPTEMLIRFVRSPDGEAVPDLAGRLPGRGAWLTADRALVERAVTKRLFSRAFKAQTTAPDDLADRLEAQIKQRLLSTLSLARKAGQAVAGSEKVRARILSGEAGILIQATDGSDDGKSKIAGLAKAASDDEIRVIECLSSTELGLAFGREFAIHAALDAGGFAGKAEADAKRLAGLCLDGALKRQPKSA